jgi:peptidoglycan/LPS O-acetylase OafA/YrhL
LAGLSRPVDSRAISTQSILRIDAPGPRDGESSHIPELDALRGLAALAVVVFHADGRWFPCGWAAVDLFFVLSGYLVTSIVLRHGKHRGFLTSFYIRRGLRIWPLYYLTIGIVVASTPWALSRPDWAGLPYTLTFTQSLPEYWGAPAPAFSAYLGHAWTLAIEEQFYLIWPALLLLAGRNRVVPLALACGAASVAARCWGWPSILLIARADGMSLGAMLAGLIEHTGKDTPKGRRLTIVARTAFLAGLLSVSLLGGFVRLRHLTHPGPTLLAYNVMFFGLVGMAVQGSGRPTMAFLRMGRLRWLGKVSYGLYLIHLVVYIALGDLARAYGITGRPAWLFVPAIGLSILLAGLSYGLIEAPILSWKRLFPYPGPTIVRRPHPCPPRATKAAGPND